MKNLLIKTAKLFLLRLSSGRVGTLGYTLVELSISTSIMAMLAVGGLAVLQKKNDAEKEKQTYVKLNKIETALKGFIRINGYIPCPALPGSIESSDSFGKEVPYNTGGTPSGSSHICDGNYGGIYLANETGMVPVRTLGLSDDTAYDGWGRKFTYRSASSSGSPQDFNFPDFKGNIAIIDINGLHKTSIKEPEPYNDGAIYVIISHGANGKNVAYTRNSSSTPSQASAIEGKNTNHSINMYIQNQKTSIFDDVVVFGTKAKLSHLNVSESPTRIDDNICDTAKSLTDDGRNTLGVTGVSGYAQNYGSRADTIFRSASILANLCKNRRSSETVSPERINGLSLWLDANDNSSLFSDNTCLTAIANGSSPNLGCWKDKSGNSGRDATLEYHSPSYVSNALNSRPAIHFSGSGAYLRTNLSFLASSAYTIITVDSRRSSNSPLYLLSITGAGSSANSSLFLGYNTGTSFDLGQTNNELTTSIPAYSANTPSLSIASLDTAVGHSIYYNSNGTEFSNTNNNVQPLNPSIATSGYIGKGFGAAGIYNGDIGEIIIYNRSISNLEKDKLKEYLSEKWQIPLSSSTSTCQPGMVFQKTVDNPQGSCQCPSGQAYIRDLRTANACYQIPTSTNLNSCVSISPTPIYSPRTPDKTNMLVWLDSNDCSTITILSNQAQSSKAVSPVSKWQDKSGNGNDATQQTITNMPLYTTNTLNSMPVIRFDGSSDNMTIPINISRSALGRPIITISTVYQFNSGGSSNTQALWGQHKPGGVGSTLDRYALLLNNGGTIGLSTGNNGGNRIQDVPRIGNNSTWQIFTATLNSNTGQPSNAWINGQSTINGGVGFSESLGNDGDSSLMIGDIGSKLSSPGKVDIAEMIIYSSDLSTTQRNYLEFYLAKKWGIAIVPDAIDGLKLWLDGADASTIYSDNTCTSSTSTGGIGCWNDKSYTISSTDNVTKVYNINHAIQTNTSKKPTYSMGAQNGHAVLQFNGTSQLLDNSTLSLPTTATIFAVASPRSATGSKIIINNDLNFYFGVGTTTNYFNSYYGDGSSWGTSTNHLPGTTPNMGTTFHVIDSVQDGANDNSFIDGTPLTIRANTMAGFTNTGYTVGSKQNANSQYWDGSIAEIIIYNTALSAIQRQYLERYLGDKWGVTIP